MLSQKEMWTSALIGSMTSFNFGINLTLHDLSKVPLTKSGSNGYTISDKSYELFISIFALSAIVSNLATPFIKINKKYMLVLIDLLFLAGVLMICFAKNSFLLFAGRVIQGYGFGFIGNSVPVYLGNIASLEKKGMIGGLHQLFIVLGVVAGQSLCFTFEKGNYKIPYFIYISFLLVHLCALSLINKVSVNQNTPTKGFKDLISTKEARKSLFLAVFLHVTQQLSCINGIIFFSNDVQTNPAKAKQNTLIGGAVLFFSTILTMFFVEKFGRKSMLLSSILIDCLCLFGVAMTDYVLAFLMIFYVGFSLGLGPIVWSISAEIFPEDFLNAGLEIAVNFNWALTFAVPYIFKQMYNKFGQKTFFFFSTYLAAAFFVILMMFKETKGKKPSFQ